MTPDGVPGSPAAVLRLVQVGAGAMGRAWLRTIRESPDAELVGLVDLDLAAARQAADDNGFPRVPVAISLEEVLERVDADAVVNVTVPTAHRTVAIGALRAGLPVLSEKPMAESVGSALAMIAAAERNGRLLMVSQSRRYFRQLTAIRELISGIGTIGLVHCELFRGNHFGGFREQMDYPLLVDMAIHQFDLARDLIGREPVAVQCESFNPTWSWYAGDASASVMVEFEGGARFSFVGSWCSIGHETSWNGSWHVSGADGTSSWGRGSDRRRRRRSGRPGPARCGPGRDRRGFGGVRPGRRDRFDPVRGGTQQRVQPRHGGSGHPLGRGGSAGVDLQGSRGRVRSRRAFRGRSGHPGCVERLAVGRGGRRFYPVDRPVNAPAVGLRPSGPGIRGG